MVNHILNFLIQGHEKIIGHYKFLLSSSGLSEAEREFIQARLREEEAAHRRLLETSEAA